MAVNFLSRFYDACKFEANDKTQDSCLSSLLESKVDMKSILNTNKLPSFNIFFFITSPL